MIETGKKEPQRPPNVIKSFEQSLRSALSGGSLVGVALSIALLEYPRINRRKYADWIDHHAREMAGTLGQSATVDQRISTLNKKMFDELGFAGNIDNYFDPQNSFLNMVIDRRLGIPITLSVLYIELGRRIGLDLDGIGLPGHFIVGCLSKGKANAADFFIDPFHGGRMMDEVDCAGMVQSLYGGRIPFQRSHLRPMAARDIVMRMINNLKAIYAEAKLFSKLLTLQEMIVILDPEDPTAIRDRGEIKYKLGDYRGAGIDLDNFLKIVGADFADDAAKTMAKTSKSNLASLN